MAEKGNPSFLIEEWDRSHPRWEEFVACLEAIAPDQVPFVLGPYSAQLPCTLFVAVQDGQVVGFIRFGVQPIGPEAHCPALQLDGEGLYEAKIHAFAVSSECRNQGIGTQLQKRVVRRARELGCYQVASYSSYGRDANYHIKLSLGFAVQPEVHGDNEQGSYFLMPLRVPDLD
jgi:GNAT superfamily N-acetyltransferase